MPNAGHDIYDECDGQWELTCHQCFKTISPTRPPVFNPDNCSCAETGTFANGDNRPVIDQQNTYQYESVAYHPQSSTASSISDTCPEGPEHDEPRLTSGNTYLPLAPDTGLNEPQHRRSSSSHYDMSYQMRRFLVDQDSIRPQPSIEVVESETRFLSQDMYIQSQRSKKQRRRSKLSYQSVSSVSGEANFSSGGSDLMVGVGTWDDVGRNENAYPMTISGLTDSGSER